MNTRKPKRSEKGSYPCGTSRNIRVRNNNYSLTLNKLMNNSLLLSPVLIHVCLLLYTYCSWRDDCVHCSETWVHFAALAGHERSKITSWQWILVQYSTLSTLIYVIQAVGKLESLGLTQNINIHCTKLTVWYQRSTACNPQEEREGGDA